ncbi:MAG: MOSC domain-containing protein [Hydrogenophilaceae bacterium]
MTALPPAAPLLSLRTGRVAAFGPQGEPSAIAKLPVAGRVAVGLFGLAGDNQADRVHHGGVDKALHHYPFDHYGAWLMELPERANLLHSPGAFGENLATLGMTEADVCLGDLFRLGSALIQVSQGRQPCWKLNQRFGVTDMVTRVLTSGRTGWYYRVLEPGEVAAGDPIVLVERGWPEWPLTRLWQVLFGPAVDAGALAELARLDVLAAGWRERAARRLGQPD